MNKEKQIQVIVELKNSEICDETMIINTKENIASLIATSYKNDIAIYTVDGEFILNTFGCFLNKCDEQYRSWLIDELVDIQLSHKEPCPVKIAYEGCEGKDEYIKYLTDNFNIIFE